MIPGREFLERCSTDTGFRVAALEKVVRLGEVMGAIGSHPLLSTTLALKGGTALNLAFGPPTRLSVDLDFNYVGSTDRQEMLEAKPGIEATVVTLGRRLGYSVQLSADEFAGRKVYLNYRSVLGPTDRIEVDLNYLMRQPIGAPRVGTLWQPGGLDEPRTLLVSPMELAIGKFLALLDRGAVRDVWDAANLPQALVEVVHAESFRPWFVAMAAILPNPLANYTRARLDNRMTTATIDEQLLPMLAGGNPSDPATLVERAWSVVAPFLHLRGNEAAYHDAFSAGDLRADLLFGTDGTSWATLEAHPAIRWRLQNIRGYLEKTSRKRLD